MEPAPLEALRELPAGFPGMKRYGGKQISRFADVRQGDAFNLGVEPRHPASSSSSVPALIAPQQQAEVEGIRQRDVLQLPRRLHGQESVPSTQRPLKTGIRMSLRSHARLNPLG